MPEGLCQVADNRLRKDVTEAGTDVKLKVAVTVTMISCPDDAAASSGA